MSDPFQKGVEAAKTAEDRLAAKSVDEDTQAEQNLVSLLPYLEAKTKELGFFAFRNPNHQFKEIFVSPRDREMLGTQGPRLDIRFSGEEVHLNYYFNGDHDRSKQVIGETLLKRKVGEFCYANREWPERAKLEDTNARIKIRDDGIQRDKIARSSHLNANWDKYLWIALIAGVFLWIY